MGCGKFHNKFFYLFVGVAQGFVLGENNNGQLLVETRTKDSLIVSPPRLEKYNNNDNKECFRWVFEEDECDNKRFIVTQYHAIQTNTPKYNNLIYLTYLVPKCVYRRVGGEEGMKIKKSLSS